MAQRLLSLLAAAFLAACAAQPAPPITPATAKASVQAPPPVAAPAPQREVPGPPPMKDISVHHDGVPKLVPWSPPIGSGWIRMDPQMLGAKGADAAYLQVESRSTIIVMLDDSEDGRSPFSALTKMQQDLCKQPSDGICSKVVVTPEGPSASFTVKEEGGTSSKITMRQVSQDPPARILFMGHWKDEFTEEVSPLFDEMAAKTAVEFVPAPPQVKLEIETTAPAGWIKVDPETVGASDASETVVDPKGTQSIMILYVSRESKQAAHAMADFLHGTPLGPNGGATKGAVVDNADGSSGFEIDDPGNKNKGLVLVRQMNPAGNHVIVVAWWPASAEATNRPLVEPYIRSVTLTPKTAAPQPAAK